MPACHAGGRGFEPLPGRHFSCWLGLAGVAQLAEQLICNQQVAGSSPITSSNDNFFTCRGWVPERPKGADCKSAVTDFGGSNPPLPTKINMPCVCTAFIFPFFAEMAELAYALDSDSSEGNFLQVQVLFSAPKSLMLAIFLFWNY